MKEIVIRFKYDEGQLLQESGCDTISSAIENECNWLADSAIYFIEIVSDQTN